MADQDEKISELDFGTPLETDVLPYVDTVLGVTKKAYKSELKGEKGDTGEKGDKGDAGVAGEKGDKGDKGDTGDTGATGAAGANGTNGTDGADGADGVSAYVYIAYASDALGTGFTTTFDADLDYIAVLSTDTAIAPLQASDFAGLWKNYKGATGETGETGAAGADGATGPAGADGADGADGKTVLSGAVDPTTEGVDGDFYINTTSNEIFGPKTGGAWGTGTSLVGPQGEQGPAGEGSGDMLAATYDPTNKAADAFSTDNHVDGTTNKVFTATEKTKLAGIETAADVTDAGNVGSSIHGATAKASMVDADKVAIIDTEASNVLKTLSWAYVKSILKTYFDSIYAPALGADDNYVTDAEKTAVGTIGNKLDASLADGSSINDDSSNEYLKFGKTASAVNEVTITNAAANGNPIIAATGDDTSVGLDITTKGSDGITFWVANKVLELLKLVHVASAVNEITISNAAANNPPTISATGGDSNIDINLVPKGTGVVKANGTEVSTAVKASGAELDTGTDDAKFATAKALKDSHNVPSVAPGDDGNVLTSNGTDWVSEAPAGGGTSCSEFLIPEPLMRINASSDPVTIVGLGADGTTMWVGKVFIPANITVAQIVFWGVAGAGGDTVKISLYSEDGQTRLFSVVSDELSGSQATNTATVSNVAVAAGYYYLTVHKNNEGAGNPNVGPWVTTGATRINGIIQQASAPCEGTYTITAYTTPATLTLSSISPTTQKTLAAKFVAA